MPSRQGKCTNYAGCLLAYRNETIIIPEGDFVCPECGQPLTPATAAAKGSPKLIPLLIVGGIGLLVLIGGFAVYKEAKRVTRNQNAPATSPTPEPQRNESAAPSPAPTSRTANAIPTATPPPAISAPVTSGASSALTPADTGSISAGSEIKASVPNMDLKNAENQSVKAEVLKRVDLIPNLSSDTKDKLYVSVDRARQMGKVITIPFGSGKTTLSAGDVEKLKAEIKSPELQALLQDPTCVFVILGFADTKGDEKTNLKISQDRAQSVLVTLRDKCGIQNVLHAVGMGGSTLFDGQGKEKNRAAEVWAVLP